MACPAENTLLAFAGGRLEEEPFEGVEEHLDGCPTCRRLYAALARAESPAAHEPTLASRRPATLAPPAGRVRRRRLALVAVSLVAAVATTAWLGGRDHARLPAPPRAPARPDEVVLARARAAVADRPREALRALLELPNETAKAGAARMIAADAIGHGRPTLVLQGHGGDVWDVEIAAGGATILSAGEDGTVRAWDPLSGEGRVVRRHRRPVRALPHEAPSAPPGAVRVAIEGATIVLTDPATGESRRLLGHTGPVHDVAVAPSGAWLVSGGADGTVRVWRDDLPSEMPALRLQISAFLQTPVGPRSL